MWQDLVTLVHLDVWARQSTVCEIVEETEKYEVLKFTMQIIFLFQWIAMRLSLELTVTQGNNIKSRIIGRIGDVP